MPVGNPDLSCQRYYKFESIPLQRRVHCEPVDRVVCSMALDAD